MKHRLCALLLLLLCWGPVFGAAEQPSEKAMTLMVYLTGSDLETGSGSASMDFLEMCASGFDADRLNLLVMAGGSSRWGLGLNVGETVILEVSAAGKYRVVSRQPARNMGAPGTLADFLSFGAEHYPAGEYALILWDHGGGPMEGVCYDEICGMDSLSMGELSTALAASPFTGEDRLSFIGFDACMMASVETACVCAPYARYMIASQETEPATGWDYSFLRFAGKETAGDDLGRRIVAAYCDPKENKKALTLSCVDLDAIDGVTAAMDTLFSALGERLTAESFSTQSNERRETKGFGRLTTGSDYDLADLWHLASRYAAETPAEAEALQQALERAVVCSGGNQPDAHGLSVYSPYYNKRYFTGKWQQEYKDLAFLPAYARYMDRYAGLWLGEQLADWRGIAYRALPLTESGAQPLELTLTEEQMAHFASARVLILRESGINDSYYNIYEIDDLTPDGLTLRASYDYSALYAVDEKGNPLTDSYPFTFVDGYYWISAMLQNQSWLKTAMLEVTGQESDYEKQVVYLQCRPDGTGDLEIVNVIAAVEEEGQLGTGKQQITLNPAAWPYIYFVNSIYPSVPRRGEDGELLPFSRWEEMYLSKDNEFVVSPEGELVEYGDWYRGLTRQNLAEAMEEYHFFGEADNRKPWSLRILPRQFSGSQLYAQFIIADTQGNEKASELIPLHNPAVTAGADVDQVVYSEHGVRVTLDRVETVISDRDDGLYFYFTAENDTDEAFLFWADDLRLNNACIDGNADFINYLGIAPRQQASFYWKISAEDLPPLSGDAIELLHFLPFLFGYDAAGEVDLNRAYPSREADIRLNLDISGLKQKEERDFTPRAGAEEGDLKLELMNLSEEANGTLKALLHIANTGEDSHRVNISHTDSGMAFCTVNGYFLANSVSVFNQVTIPAGCELYAPIAISRVAGQTSLTAAGKSVYEAVDAFDYWSIDEVRSLGLFWYEDGAERNTLLTLEEPWRLNRQPKGTAPASRQIADNDLIGLWFRQAALRDGILRLDLDVSFRGGREELVTLGAYGAVNGIQSELLGHFETMGDQTGLLSFPWRVGIHQGICRMALEISAEGIGPDTFGNALLYLLCSPVDATGEVLGIPDFQVITLGIADPAHLLAEGPQDAGVLDVQTVEESAYLGLEACFASQAILPEAASVEAAVLRFPLDEDQAQKAAEAYVLLVQAGGEGYRLCAVLQDVVLADGAAAVPFDGLLYTFARAESIPFQTPFAGGAALAGVTLRQDETAGMRAALTLQADPISGALTVRSDHYAFYGGIDGLRAVRAAALPSEWVRLSPDDEGRCAHYLDAEPLPDAPEETVQAPLTLEARSARTLDLSAWLCVTDRDGSRYGILLPYGRAVGDD